MALPDRESRFRGRERTPSLFLAALLVLAGLVCPPPAPAEGFAEPSPAPAAEQWAPLAGIAEGGPRRKDPGVVLLVGQGEVLYRGRSASVQWS
ncbi:MAG: hypothetical protein U0411_02365 [Thermodesulfovibrionales bacterium]